MKRKSDRFLKDKLLRYQNNELAREEKTIIDDWFEGERLASADQFPKNEPDAEQVRLEISARLHQQINPAKTYKLPYYWLGIACSLFLVIGIAIYYYPQRMPNSNTPVATEQVFHTPNGKMNKITLKDGTEIWMNAGTTLRVAADFSHSRERKVYLDQGEAFFSVKRDTLRPFSIATKNMLTTVLGTSFNIRAYPEAKIYQVAVNTGKVKVARKNNKQWSLLSKGLLKGEVLTYHSLSGKTDIAPHHAKLISNWRTNREIYADGLTLREIGAQISRQYAIEVKVTKNENEQQKYHLILPHEDLKIVLQRLTIATGMNYQLSQSQLIINPARP